MNAIWVSKRKSPDSLVEETNDLASNVLPPGLLVVHDAGRGGEDDVAELTRGEELDNPLLEVAELDVVAGRDDTGLVQAAVQLDDNLAVPVVVDLLKLANVACMSLVSGQYKHWTSLRIRKRVRSPLLMFRALKGQRSWDD